MAEINFLLIGLLREMGLDAYPVLLSTREHGQVFRDFPLLTYFNYVVGHVTVGGKSMLLDATDPLLPAGTLPVRCLNGSGRLVAPRQARWVELTPGPSRLVRNVTITVGKDGALTGTLEQTRSGYAAHEARRQVATGTLDAFQAKQVPEGWRVANVKQTSGTELDAPLRMQADFEADEPWDLKAGRVYLAPLVGMHLGANPLKARERRFPVDFAHPFEETVIVNYQLPEGWEPETLPQPTAVSLPNGGGRFTYQFSQQDGQLQVTSQLLVRRKTFTANEYPYLRAFYDQVVQKHAEKVVLRKK